jgi:hypothetical protein
MEEKFQLVIGSDKLLLLDGFLSYNQVLVVNQDRLKTTFQTKY